MMQINVYMYIWYGTPYGTVVVDWMELMKEPSWAILLIFGFFCILFAVLMR
jgi:hypothetical protein